ncbi:MAG: FG-GAP repeat protein [Sandaracinaceae bacterium]|nr:FG-GAP repeat protein [Sandaracinaceae bacterium]
MRAPNGTWSQQAYIKASNPNTSDYFGSAVWVDGDTLIVGAPEQNGATTGLDAAATTTGASNSGAAYVFARDGLGDWTQRAYVKATNAEMDDEFGDPVCVSGDTIVVGVPFEDSNATGINGDQADWRSPDSGAVYVWRLPAVP